MTTTVLFQWIFNKPDVPPEVRRDALARVSVHAVLLICLFWYLVGFVPLFAENLGFGARLPWLIQVLIDHSDFVKEWFLPLVLFVLAGLIVDYRFYVHLYHKSGRKTARLWAYSMNFLLTAINVFYVFAWLSFEYFPPGSRQL